jgi:WD40 repeat protein
LNAVSPSDLTVTNIVRGHYAPSTTILNELWGLCTLNDDDHYITCSDDGTLRLWSSSRREMVYWIRMDRDDKGNILEKVNGKMHDSGRLRSVDVRHKPAGYKNNWVAVGCFDGTIRVSFP